MGNTAGSIRGLGIFVEFLYRCFRRVSSYRRDADGLDIEERAVPRTVATAEDDGDGVLAAKKGPKTPKIGVISIGHHSESSDIWLRC